MGYPYRENSKEYHTMHNLRLLLNEITFLLSHVALGKTASVSAPKDNTCTYHALMVSSKNLLVGELLMVKLSTGVLHTLPMAAEFTLVILCCWLNAHSTHMNGGTIKSVCVCVCERERERAGIL